MNTALKKTLTRDDYFELERTSETKHEFFHGEVFAMAGVRDRHNEIALNFALFLRGALRGKGCGVYISDVRLEVDEGGHYTYPDVFVTCDPRDRDNPLTKRHASLVVEVLSEGTAAYDRGLKAQQYRRMPSLRGYVLIDPDTQTVEVQTRGEGSAWTLVVYGAAGEVAALPFEGLGVPWAEVFARME
jgi:Uma2 family endonuclease